MKETSIESPLTWKKISVTRTGVFARATRASHARARRALPSTRASSERTTTTPTTTSTADDLPTGSLERFLVAHLEFASRALEEANNRSDVSASRRNNDDSERRRRRPTMRPDCSNFNLNRGIPEQLDASDTAPPPLPPWLRGFLVTARKREHAAVAGEEVASLCDDIFLREIDGVGGSREKTPPAGKRNARSTRVFAESLLIPGCPGSVFVAIKPDDADVDVVALAEKIIEDVDDDAARADVCWSRTAHAQRIIPVERIAPEYDLERLAREVIAKKFPARGRATDRGPPPTFKARSSTELVPIRPRPRGERRSSRTFSPGASLRPSRLAFNPDTPRRL
eukprot:30333-Pelagococcus_subviridis.AAC.7